MLVKQRFVSGQLRVQAALDRDWRLAIQTAMLDIPPKYWNPPHPWRRQRFPPGTGAISK
jgi:hypothetical protein